MFAFPRLGKTAHPTARISRCKKQSIIRHLAFLEWREGKSRASLLSRIDDDTEAGRIKQTENPYVNFRYG